jgi:Zn-dependent membrane protease YugP
MAGIYDVTVQHVAGNLTDHYDPRNKTLNLSDAVYANASVAAVGVAAHEAGHAIQHDRGYAPLKLRSALAPVASIGANISWPIILVGLLLGGSPVLIEIGILMFSLAVAFQLITLPVEFNASKRALTMLEDTGVLYADELPKTRKVLNAAALTYVAAAASSILQLLRLVLLFGNRRRD